MEQKPKMYKDGFKQEYKDDKVVIGSVTDNEMLITESHLLNLPLDVLEMIMKFCVCVEYMNFRATCKRCRLAAPVIQWRDKAASRRLQNYSVASPWLMEVHEKPGIISFTDPVFGDKYFMKSLQVLNFRTKICYSRFGWLLLDTRSSLVLYNPFTSNMHNLPYIDCLPGTLCFSAPPTSPDCMVVGFLWGEIYIHRVAQEPLWRRLPLNTKYICYSPTFYGGDLYFLYKKGELHVLKDLDVKDYIWEKDVADTPRGFKGQSYLTTYDQHLLLVMVEESGKAVKRQLHRVAVAAAIAGAAAPPADVLLDADDDVAAPPPAPVLHCRR